MEPFTSWGAPQAALLITGRDLIPREITEELGLTPTFSREATANASFRPGEGCWAISITAEADQGFDTPVEKLIESISPALGAIRKVHRRGYAVQLDLSGHVRKGSRARLSPQALNSLARLELPVSLTTDADPPTRSEDLLDWLPAPDGSHRAT
ncbi:DUF4279 domain-containing protein [Streptomyces sp. NPDC005227]|uniref:DUF4279 domain-containing protein n=1 Tax=unclassified Streptomyces TaxID=2593676 RepID=UPI003690F32D